MSTAWGSRPRPKPTSQQPERQVVTRYRENGVTWAVLDCEHTEPANDRPMATHLRCTSCLPIRRPDAPELPPPRDPYGRPA
ncbi:MAG: hypothetical protein ACXV2J_13475 [Actinomycetes bacterium]